MMSVRFVLALALLLASPVSGRRGIRGLRNTRSLQDNKNQEEDNNNNNNDKNAQEENNANDKNAQENNNNDKNQDNVEDEETIFDILSDKDNQDEYSTLAELLEDAGLAATLDTEGPFTLFAPTNAAFAAMDPVTLAAVQADNGLLQQVLLFHVMNDTAYAAANLTGVAPNATFPTMNAANDLTLNVTTVFTNTITTEIDPVPAQLTSKTIIVVNGAATVTRADVGASNGVIHSIDAVLIPEVTVTTPPEPEQEEGDKNIDAEEEENEEEDKNQEEKVEEEDKEVEAEDDKDRPEEEEQNDINAGQATGGTNIATMGEIFDGSN